MHAFDDDNYDARRVSHPGQLSGRSLCTSFVRVTLSHLDTSW